MKIIGINSGYDAAKQKIYSGGSAYVYDGKIMCALAEERISREKHEGGFLKSLKHIYNEYNISVEDVDYFYISFYANPIIPKREIVLYHLKMLGLEKHPEKLVVMPSHHFSHAFLAHILSPFRESIIMVADNEGNIISPKDAERKGVIFNECERNSYFWAKENNITLIERDFENVGEVSFGKMYNKFNEYIGFDSYLNAGKTMGLSSYGEIPEEWEKLDLWYMDKQGKLHSNVIETHDSFNDIEYFFARHGITITRGRSYECQEYKNLAYFVQNQLNKWSTKKIEYLKEKFGVENICVSGGVGLNSIMNYSLEKNLSSPVFVPPYCSDPGQALGNALYGWCMQSGKCNNSYIKKVKFDDYIYLGTQYDNSRIDSEINTLTNDERICIHYSDHALEMAADLIADHKIVAYFNGRSEYGARALGNRSILAMPDSEEIRDRINILKGRELFRPLAPAVLEEYRDEYFEGESTILDTTMLKVVPVKENKKMEIKGVTHIDGTARLQVVKKEINQRFYQLISKVYQLTGIPMIINTSFNVAGEPIVETVLEAVEAFLDMNLDALLCGNYIITRNKKNE